MLGWPNTANLAYSPILKSCTIATKPIVLIAVYAIPVSNPTKEHHLMLPFPRSLMFPPFPTFSLCPLLEVNARYPHLRTHVVECIRSPATHADKAPKAARHRWRLLLLREYPMMSCFPYVFFLITTSIAMQCVLSE